jgi:hypothetical protein
MSTSDQLYYFAQIERLLNREQIRTHFEQDIFAAPMRWIPCGLCTSQCFRSREHSVGSKMTEICNRCRELLFKQLIRYYVFKVDKINIQERKKYLHKELLEFCFRPEYVLKTGCVETQHLFRNH